MDSSIIISSESEGEIETKLDSKTSKSEMVDHYSVTKKRKDSLTPLKRRFEASSYRHVTDDDEENSKKGKGSPEEVVVKADQALKDTEHLDEEEWVTVVGFSKKDIELVLRKFEKYGEILDHVRTPGTNWMHILYQKRSEAQKVLTMSWLQINGGLLVGVKPVDPIQRVTLNEPSQPVADQIKEALQERLCLLHCCEADFFNLGATGDVFNVRLSTTPSCSCPDRMVPCKHTLFVFLRVLEVSLSDSCVRRKTLEPGQLTRHSTPPHHPKSLLVLVYVRDFFIYFQPSHIWVLHQSPSWVSVSNAKNRCSLKMKYWNVTSVRTLDMKSV
ncbi:hypothetical protein MKW98_026945 [Papaver atlanticum]|uniref:Uncharacterized protein n=1 Tax=Papaver atlanticum TaxID=357466 RepID=A0AAD4SVF6_9MAGN|nr:hypothetical protein MKW98_026945 [Papaver atlanticum]